MYDRIPPLNFVDIANFSFVPKEYEIWKGGKLIGSGKLEGRINIFHRKIQGHNIVTICSKESGDEHFLSNKPIDLKNLLNNVKRQDELIFELSTFIGFDQGVTQTDRLQLISVPEDSNSTCSGLEMLKQVFGSTCYERNFMTTDPYCCSIFMINKVIEKVSFSFSNPEKLIEFYGTKRAISDSEKLINSFK